MAMLAITAAALKANISIALLFGICMTESNLKHTINVNDGGSASYGICQIKHETAKMFNKSVRASYLMTDVGSSEYAAKYLRFQLDRYNGDVVKAISAFNAGSAISKNKSYINKVLINKTKYEVGYGEI